MLQSPAVRPSIFRRLLLALVLASLPGLSLAELRIGVTVGNLDNYIAYLVRAMQDRAKQVEGGATLQVEDSASDVVRQLGQVENFIAQKVDVLIVNPADTAATRKITERALAAGIPLVYLNSRPEVESFPAGVVFVGTDERAIGQLQMEYLATQMGGKGHLAIILGRLAHDDTRKRTAGVKDVLAKYPGIKVVEEQSGDWQREKGLDLMNNWLLGGREIDAVAANNDEMGIGAAMALQQAGKAKGSVLIGGVDGTPDGLSAIKRGLLAVSVFQDAKGQANGAVEAAIKLAKKEKVEQNVWVPYQLITPENVDSFQQRLKD